MKIRHGCGVVALAWAFLCTAGAGDEPLSLEPKENTWAMDVELLAIGVLDLRNVPDIHVPKHGDSLKDTLGWKDLPPPVRTEADREKKMLLDQPRARRFLYVVFNLHNLTRRPVLDPATNLPKVDKKGNVIYRYVKINTRKVVPDVTRLDVKKTREKIPATIHVFLDADPRGELAKEGLWPGRISAVDVRLEKKMTPEERARYATSNPYLEKFLDLTGDYDLVKGSDTLPPIIEPKQVIRGVAFFAGLPRGLDRYDLYFSGISNRYRIRRVGRLKTAYFLRMVRFSFEESGDEFEISRDILKRVDKTVVYRPQYMGLYPGVRVRRLKKWNEERRRLEELGMMDPVEKWETQPPPQK